MLHKSSPPRERIRLLLFVILALSLFGCGPRPEAEPAQPVSAQAIDDGNIDNGRALFMGNAHFEYDAPPCMGCHNVGENGLLGGGVMGPDLTDISTRLNEGEIASILSSNGPTLSPVMKPIFTEHPLTESEQADLIAFLEASVGQPESDKELLVVGISLAGFVAAVGVLGFVYRGRLRSVRKALVNKAQKELL